MVSPTGPTTNADDHLEALVEGPDADSALKDIQQHEAQDLYLDGVTAALKGKRAAAERLLLAAVTLDPQCHQAWLWLGGIADSPERSVEYLQRAADLAPGDPHVMEGLAWARARLTSTAPPSVAAGPSVTNQAPVPPGQVVARPVSPVPPVTPPGAPKRPRRRFVLEALGGLAVLCLALLVCLWAVSRYTADFALPGPLSVSGQATASPNFDDTPSLFVASMTPAPRASAVVPTEKLQSPTTTGMSSSGPQPLTDVALTGQPRSEATSDTSSSGPRPATDIAPTAGPQSPATSGTSSSGPQPLTDVAPTERPQSLATSGTSSSALGAVPVVAPTEGPQSRATSDTSSSGPRPATDIAPTELPQSQATSVPTVPVVALATLPSTLSTTINVTIVLSAAPEVATLVARPAPSPVPTGAVALASSVMPTPPPSAPATFRTPWHPAFSPMGALRPTDWRIPAVLWHEQIQRPGKWIEVDLSEQVLRAYENGDLVLETAVSTGTKRTPTPKGEYRVLSKYRAIDMSGPGYYLPGVPYTMFFHDAYALHGTTWHDKFGQPMSHGCVNLRVEDAKRLFEWADPKLPKGSRTVMAGAKKPGTLVVIHD